MNSARVVYTSPSITPEQARDTRALALRFVFDCYAKKKAEGRLHRPTAKTEPQFKEIPPMQLYGNDPDVLPAVRELLSRLPSRSGLDAHDLVNELYACGYLSYRPDEVAVEVALGALEVEGEVLA